MKTALRASTSIPYEVKILLDALDPSDERPPQLAKWARDVFKAGRKFERTNEEIAKWIEQYALEKDYSQRQIQRVLKDNGYIRHPEKINKNLSGHMSASTYNYIGRLKDLTQAITELDDHQIENTGLNPSRAAEQAQPNIVDIASQGSTAEKESLLHYVQLSIALLQRLESILRQSGKGIKLTP